MNIANHRANRELPPANFLRIVLGLLCGVSATGPMSAAMVFWHRRLPQAEKYPLPPREITNQAVNKVAEPSSVDAETRSALTWLAHFGYGGATGALYAAAQRFLPGNAALQGSLFGLIVWTVSYFGLLPGLRVLKPAGQHPLRRSLLMIGAHFVWGITLAALYQVLTSDRDREGAAFHRSTRPPRDVARISGDEDDHAERVLHLSRPTAP